MACWLTVLAAYWALGRRSRIEVSFPQMSPNHLFILTHQSSKEQPCVCHHHPLQYHHHQHHHHRHHHRHHHDHDHSSEVQPCVCHRRRRLAEESLRFNLSFRSTAMSPIRWNPFYFLKEHGHVSHQVIIIYHQKSNGPLGLLTHADKIPQKNEYIQKNSGNIEVT